MSLTIVLTDEQTVALIAIARAKGLSPEEDTRHNLAPEWLRRSWDSAVPVLYGSPQNQLADQRGASVDAPPAPTLKRSHAERICYEMILVF
jgi:hypothetical protein